MSRIGNNPIEIPEGVEINVQGSHVSVKGPKGTLERDINENLIVTIEDKKVTVKRPNDETEMKNLHGLTRTLIANMIIGVKEEFTKELQVNGVGYRVQKQGNDLNLVLGYSHNIVYKAPQGISFDVPNPNTIIVKELIKN